MSFGTSLLAIAFTVCILSAPAVGLGFVAQHRTITPVSVVIASVPLIAAALVVLAYVTLVVGVQVGVGVILAGAVGLLCTGEFDRLGR